MSRIRSVHPRLFSDESFVTASPFARLLMIGLWTEAWDDGVFEWKPVTLKIKLLGADNVDVAALLAELEALNVIMSFDVGGKRYGAVRNFCKFQRPKKPSLSGVMTEAVANFVALKESESGTSSEPPPPMTEKSPQKGGREEGRKGGRKEESTNLRSVETADAGPVGEKMILDLIEAIGPVGARDGVLSPAGLKPILRLIDAGCDFDADVLPAVREQCAKLNEPLRTLDAGFLRDAIHERRAARAKGAKPAAKQVFVIKDTPEWQAWADHLVRCGQPAPKAMGTSIGDGRYFPTQLPSAESMH